jgi:diamine N-acetyltransferase
VTPVDDRVQLRPVTEDNRAAVEALVVTEEQSDYVAGVAESLVEAAETPDAKPVYWAIYDGATPVGFVMISDGITVENPSYLGPYYLWRLVVGQEHQGQGYGAAALRLVVDYLRTQRPDATELLTSCVQGPASPIGFYLGFGFRRTGEIHEGEVVLTLDLGSG